MDAFHLFPSSGQEHHHVQGASVTRESQADEREEFFSTNVSSQAASTMGDKNNHHSGRKARKIVLCFDGTGNKFHGDDSDSNILKIYRMLDRTASDQCESSFSVLLRSADTETDHYYQRKYP